MSKPVLSAKRRRKGFESVRKDSCIADARLMFFEKEKVYCKLTVANDIQKGLLHVSLGAVGSCCRGALRNGFSLSVSFAWAEKTLFSRTKKFFVSRKLYELHSKPFLRTKASFVRAFLRCSQKIPIFTNQKPFFAQTFTNCPQKPPFHVQKAFYSHKPFLVAIQNSSFPPFASHSNTP